MDLSSVISFIKEKRKILISLFITVGILSASVDGLILVQRPQTYKSKATSSSPPPFPENVTEFTSPRGLYSLSYDARLWVPQKLETRTIFNLNQEYGFARLDIVEGDSDQDLDSLTQEIIKESAPVKVESTQFQGKPSNLLTYQEEVVGEDVYFYKQLVKDGSKFLILEKRVPNLGYSNSFLDNLLLGLSLTNLESPQVKGIASSSDNLTTVQLVDLVRPSIANVVNVYCLQINNLQPATSGLSKPQYNFCSLTKGSGFMVNEKGIVATNGHVVKIYPEEGLMTNLLYEGNKAFTTDLIREVHLSKGQTPTQPQIEDFYQQISSNPQYLDRFLAEILRLIEKKVITVNISDQKYYVNVGDAPVRIDYQKMGKGDYINSVIPSQTTYSAKLLDFDFPNRYSFNAVINKIDQPGSDVALLQIANSANNLFPALELGSTENLREGSDVIIAGYPILVEGADDPRSAISYKTSTKPTITRGIISAVKQDPTSKTIFQTDASIDHGNSGGPAFNLSAQVIGIASFQIDSQSGNFNFLRDVSDLKALMSKNNIDNRLGESTVNWRKGLAEYRDQYYNQAIKYFNKVESQSPSHPTVKELISLSEQAINRGESLEGLASFTRGKHANIMLIVFGGISIVSFMSAGFLTILPFFRQDEVD